MQNTWREHLVLVFPQTRWLRFIDFRTGKLRQWISEIYFVSTDEFAFDIVPYGTRDFVIETRYADTYQIGELTKYQLDFCRYQIDLPSGKYHVQYCYEIDSDFFDCDSHGRFADLLEFAAEINARAWTGETKSNQILIDRDNHTAG